MWLLAQRSHFRPYQPIAKRYLNKAHMKYYNIKQWKTSMKMTCQTQMIFQVRKFFNELDNNGNDGNNTSNRGNLFF